MSDELKDWKAGYRSAFEQKLAELRKENDGLRGKIKELEDWIIEADSVFNANGYINQNLDECLSLVYMCHEGRKAMDEVNHLRSKLDKAREALLASRSALSFRIGHFDIPADKETLRQIKQALREIWPDGQD